MQTLSPHLLGNFPEFCRQCKLFSPTYLVLFLSSVDNSFPHVSFNFPEFWGQCSPRRTHAANINLNGVICEQTFLIIRTKLTQLAKKKLRNIIPSGSGFSFPLLFHIYSMYLYIPILYTIYTEVSNTILHLINNIKSGYKAIGIPVFIKTLKGTINYL